MRTLSICRSSCGQCGPEFSYQGDDVMTRPIHFRRLKTRSKLAPPNSLQVSITLISNSNFKSDLSAVLRTMWKEDCLVKTECTVVGDCHLKRSSKLVQCARPLPKPCSDAQSWKLTMRSSEFPKCSFTMWRSQQRLLHDNRSSVDTVHFRGCVVPCAMASSEWGHHRHPSTADCTTVRY